MTHKNSTNPYESPDAYQTVDVATPKWPIVEAALVSAILLGCLTFVGTCFGGTFFAIGYAHEDPKLQWVYSSIFAGSGIIGLVTAIVVGRTKYRTALESSNRRLEQEKHDNQP